jgi:formamidopyrimidine-DNA glycosylase
MARLTGLVKGGTFRASFRVSRKKSGVCERCGRPVRRSWVTEILHDECRACRYLVMMYGPSITVRLVES